MEDIAVGDAGMKDAGKGVSEKKGKIEEDMEIERKKKGKLGGGILPDLLESQRREMTCGIEGPRNVETIEAAGAYASLGLVREFSLQKFMDNFSVEITSLTADKLVFEMKGIDVAIANAFRRVMIAEVPTMAIETIHLYQNTGVIQDEVLCHRIGLVPFKVNPDHFASRAENEELNGDNSLCFRLHVLCTAQNIDPLKKCRPVYSRDFVWQPMGERQKELYKDAPPAPINPHILITKLKENQEIDMTCYLEKGTGKTHAKWTAAAPAFYRLQPRIHFPAGRPFTGEMAHELKELCPMDVFDVKNDETVVIDPKRCTTCRACIERFPNQIEIRKIKDHFICKRNNTLRDTYGHESHIDTHTHTYTHPHGCM